MNASDREYDIVVWGASGFTGRLVAAYLLGRNTKAPNAGERSAENGQPPLKMAWAGRNRDKLEALRKELSAQHPEAADIPILIADADDAASLEQLVRATRVVCTTVGPYAKYGAKLVAACVAAGTHYCDLCGEVQFIRRMIDAHHEGAVRSGARIVHSCGFDSIPSDLGVLMLQTAREQRGEPPLTEIKYFVGKTRGGFSGGTVASMMHLMQELQAEPDLRKVVGDPYALDPPERLRGPDGRDQVGVRYDDDIEAWTGPFVMAAINTRIVRRSNALMQHRYGRDFRYAECTRTGPGIKGLATATALTTGLGGLLAASSVAPLRRLLQAKVLPEPGEGPSEDTMRNGYFEIELLGKDATGNIAMRGKICCDADPGYRGTAIMLGESALCLARGEEAPGSIAGGVLTPATAVGMPLVERLRGAGMKWTVE